MGSGKQKQLCIPVDGGVPTSPNPRRFDVNARNLPKTHLGGVIFGCTNSTFRECLSKQLFGLPSQHFAYVKNIDPGLPLFLFNYTDRKLHGIFEAASSGKMNIDPYGWTAGGSERTQYPAQVQTHIRLQCQPLQESQFRPIIADNYYNLHHFWFELDYAQTNKLISVLSSSPVSPSAFVPRDVAKQKMVFRALPWREPGEKIRPSASESDLSYYSNQKSDSTNSVDRCKQPSEAQLDAEEINLMIMKLKQLQDYEYPDLPASRKEMDNDLESRMPLEDTVGPDELIESQENKDGDFSLSECQSMVTKLVQEVQGLKDYITQQDQKVVCLEQKMVEAEAEIQNLKRQLTPPNSLPSEEFSEDTALNSSDKEQLDPDESIFLIGGYNSVIYLSSLDSYYPSADVIKACQPMSCLRSYAGVVRLGGELYVFGGGNGYAWYNTVESYNQETDRWTCRPSLNKEKGNLGGAAIDGKIFAVGGGNGKECFSDVEMLDLDLGRWILTRSMLQKRFALAAVELNGAIYATGGYDGSDYLNSAERFDPREHSWCKIPCMTVRRGCHSLVVFDEKLYAIGGFDGSSMVSSTEIYDPRRGSWIAGESMKNPRGYAAAVALNESIHVIGGVKATDTLVDTVETYREGVGWQETRPKAIGKRCFLSSIVR